MLKILDQTGKLKYILKDEDTFPQEVDLPIKDKEEEDAETRDSEVQEVL